MGAAALPKQHHMKEKTREKGTLMQQTTAFNRSPVGDDDDACICAASWDRALRAWKASSAVPSVCPLRWYCMEKKSWWRCGMGRHMGRGARAEATRTRTEVAPPAERHKGRETRKGGTDLGLGKRRAGATRRGRNFKTERERRRGRRGREDKGTGRP